MSDRKVSIPPIPSEREPIADLIARCQREFRRNRAHKAAQKWIPITFNEAEAFGVVWFGDPHLDAHGCNWDALLRDVDIVKSTPGCYGASVGDATNNWTGRLMRIYADQNVSKHAARDLIRWFMKDAGIPWALWNIGNHDKWENGEAIISLISDGAVYLTGWRAQVEFRAAGQSWRIDSRHDFPGSSIYNKTHGPARAAMFAGGAAELYICGHRHHFGYQSFEVGENGRFAHACRIGSYKWDDEHAEQLGFSQSQVPSVMTIFNPHAETEAGRIMVFPDLEVGAAVLRSLRTAPALAKPKPQPKAKRAPAKPKPQPKAKRAPAKRKRSARK